MSLTTQLEIQTGLTLFAQHDLRYEIYRHPQHPEQHVTTPGLDLLLDLDPLTLLNKFDQLQSSRECPDWHDPTRWLPQLKYNLIGPKLILAVHSQHYDPDQPAEHDPIEMLRHPSTKFRLGVSIPAAILQLIALYGNQSPKPRQQFAQHSSSLRLH